MTALNAEATEVHSRLLKCALEVEDARSYWVHQVPGVSASAERAFHDYWFGDKSLDRVSVLLVNLRARFDTFPACIPVLHAWRSMDPVTRALLCHWHVQLSDPLYRSFTGDFLVERLDEGRSEVTRDVVVGWVTAHAPARWTLPTRIQCASKLLSTAYAAGLVRPNRDPRQLTRPRVPDGALTYLLYLLRDVRFQGTLLDNPYLRSVGLRGRDLEERLRALPALRFQRQGDLVDYGWVYADLAAWARDHLATEAA